MHNWTVVFIDSSIDVARTTRERSLKQRIASWLSQYSLAVTGSVVLREYKSRVLRDVAYLLTKLKQTGSYRDTLDFVTSVLPPQMQRRKQICLPLLHSIFPSASDEELTERARLYFRTLLVNGERDFLRRFDRLIPGLRCYGAKAQVIERKPYLSYELGERRCSQLRGVCPISEELRSRLPLCGRLLAFLSELPSTRMTAELQTAQAFLDRIVNRGGLDRIWDEDPCSTVGDLLIAIESEQVPEFYTMNFRESQAYCDALGQNLTVRPNNPSSIEREYMHVAKPWPPP